MFNRLSAVTASATLVTVGTLAFSTAALVRNDSDRSAYVASAESYIQTSQESDRSTTTVYVTPDLDQSYSLFGYMI